MIHITIRSSPSMQNALTKFQAQLQEYNIELVERRSNESAEQIELIIKPHDITQINILSLLAYERFHETLISIKAGQGFKIKIAGIE